MAVEATAFMSLLLFTSSAVSRKVVVLDDNDWDSITVTSPPVKITNSRFNANTTKPKQPKMARECPEDDIKCFYDSQLTQSTGHRNSQDTIQKFMERFSSVTNVKINEDLKNSSSKAYWNQVTPDKHNHPFEDKKGWVTMEPIPWSTSTVSRWKPNVSPPFPQSFGYGPPTSSHLWVTNGHKPAGDLYSPSSSQHWNMPANDIVTDNRPSEFPSYPSQGYQPSQQNIYPPNSYHSPSPAPYPPSNYIPSANPYQPQMPPPPTYSHFSHQNNYPVPAPKPAYTYNNNYHSSNGFQEPFKSPSFGHPSSYPSEGNGEWVLLSTTKGYSVPKHLQDRKLFVQDSMNSLAGGQADIVTRNHRSKYEENEVNEEEPKPNQNQEVNRKSGEYFEDNEPIWTVDGINILKAGKDNNREEKSSWHQGYTTNTIPEDVNPPADISFKRTVRLTVLPPVGNTSTTAHDGLLEVDSSPHTVEEEQQEEERIRKLQQLAIVNTSKQPYRIINMNAQKGRSQSLNKRKAAVLAAVGAGMIPATMAVLLPVAFGRRRRSAENINDLNVPLMHQRE